MNLLFAISFEQFIKNDLPGIRRKPKWIETLYSEIKPYEVYYERFMGVRENNLRRMYCNGSVISLEKLIQIEFGVDIDIVDNENNGRMTGLVSTAQEKVTAFIGTDKEQALFFITDRETELLQNIDYKVIIRSFIAESIRQEQIERIKSLIGLYNSAGFLFAVEYQA